MVVEFINTWWYSIVRIETKSLKPILLVYNTIIIIIFTS